MMSKTLLIADDEPHMLRTTSFILQSEGYQVLTARNGQEALEVLRRERPPVLLLDLMMPIMDGYAVCREIRADAALAGTYIMILTARGQRRDEEQALAAGANAYMSKPFDDFEILSRLEKVFADRERS